MFNNIIYKEYGNKKNNVKTNANGRTFGEFRTICII